MLSEVIFITNNKEIQYSDKNYVLYFYADWLLYHKKMMLTFGKVKRINKKIKFYAIDIDDFGSYFCNRYKIQSIPTVIFIKDGREKDRVEEIVSTTNFLKIFTDIYILETPKIRRKYVEKNSSTSKKDGSESTESKG